MNGSTKPIEKLWGIGKSTGIELFELGVRTLNDVTKMDVESISEGVKRPSEELEIARRIASTTPHDFIVKAREK
ncbi:MAG: hypothetical protein ACW99G_20740, partial [Candidatus Thorarchaeota archaeon]